MLNEAQVSLTGYVATQPVIKEVVPGTMNLSMRVGWTQRRLDRTTGEWTDGNTSYVTVICWRKLASNASICLRKGDPVVVKGRLSVRDYNDKQGMPRTSVEVEASSIGHDLTRGVATFQRVRPQTGMTAAEFSAARSAGALPAEPGADRDDDLGQDRAGTAEGAAVSEPGGSRLGDEGDHGLGDEPGYDETGMPDGSSGDVPAPGITGLAGLGGDPDGAGGALGADRVPVSV